jgi:galactonate dehydratase
MQKIVQARRARLAMAPALFADGAPDSLEIANLRGWRLREPVSRRAYTVVRVETRSGPAGYGECAGGTAAELASAARLVEGKPATAFEVVTAQLSSMPGLQAGVNMALLDIVGKSAKAPVYQLLGGPTRFRVRALAAMEGASDDELNAAVRRARAEGHRAFLVPAPPLAARNQGKAFVLAAQKRMRELRETAGSGADFVLDGAGRLTPGDAASLSAAFERFHLLWFDEPHPATNIGAIRKIAAENVTPLGFGRSVTEAGVFQDLLREDAIDVLRPAINLNGVTQIRRMAAIAETYYVAVAPYHDGGPIGTAAALHLAASLPNFYIQQIPRPAAEADRRMRAELAGKTLEAVDDGFVALPNGPGLGIAVNERALEQYGEKVV